MFPPSSDLSALLAEGPRSPASADRRSARDVPSGTFRSRRGALVIIATASLLSVLFWCHAAQAAPEAEVYFVTGAVAAAPGEEIAVGVELSASVSVNAVAVEIGYSGQLLEFVRADTGDSIIDVWRTTPEILREGIVRIEGGMSRPFAGRAGELIRLVFRIRENASANLAQWSVRTGQIVQADGRGTPVDFSTAPVSIAISPSGASASGSGGIEKVSDVRPPRLGVLTITRNPIDGSRLGVWSAADSGSGVARSEVQFRRWIAWGPWMIRENPVQIPGGVWEMSIRVTDNAGNAIEDSVIIWSAILLKLAALAAAVWLVVYAIRWRRGR